MANRIRRGDRATNPLPGVPLDKEKIKELLVKYRGNITACALALGCNRHSIQCVVANNPDIKKILDDARERTVDEVENTLEEMATSGQNITATIFLLKTRGRARGYDQDRAPDLQHTQRAAIDYALNKSRNPADQ